MNTSKLVGLNTKWYRYQLGMTQEDLSDSTNFKTAYISVIETGESNITSNTIDLIANAFKIKPKYLLEEETAIKAIELPRRVDMYNKDS